MITPNSDKYRIPETLDDFRIVLVCALQCEANAIRDALDYTYPSQQFLKQRRRKDPNSYIYGRIGGHAVVMVCLGRTGQKSAARLVTDCKSTFHNIELCLLVGICGGAPRQRQRGEETQEIYLGDVIVSHCVITPQVARLYDHGSERKTDPESLLPRAPDEIQSLVTYLKVNKEKMRIHSIFQQNLQSIVKKPAQDTDVLYPSGHLHGHRAPESDNICQNCSTERGVACKSARDTCCEILGCGRDADQMPIKDIRVRSSGDGSPEVFFGCIASSDWIYRSSRERDKLNRDINVIGFETEGAGVWGNWPTLIIKAVSDYADDHKNKDWQKYAAYVAAAYMKTVVTECQFVQEILIPAPAVPRSHPQTVNSPVQKGLIWAENSSQTQNVDVPQSDVIPLETCERIITEIWPLGGIFASPEPPATSIHLLNQIKLPSRAYTKIQGWLRSPRAQSLYLWGGYHSVWLSPVLKGVGHLLMLKGYSVIMFDFSSENSTASVQGFNNVLIDLSRRAIPALSQLSSTNAKDSDQAFAQGLTRMQPKNLSRLVVVLCNVHYLPSPDIIPFLKHLVDLKIRVMCSGSFVEWIKDVLLDCQQFRVVDLGQPDQTLSGLMINPWVKEEDCSNKQA